MIPPQTLRVPLLRMSIPYLPAWRSTSGRPCPILVRCIPITTGGPGTVHTGGDPIPSVASDRLCGSPSALKEEAMRWHWLIVLAPEYLETAIYRVGRALTVAGEVRGQRDLPVGETVYRSPFWRHAKCISGPRVAAFPRCSTLALVLGSVRAYSRRWRLKWSTEWPAHMRSDCRAAWTGVHLKLEGGVREDYRSTSISPVNPATAAELDGARNQRRSDLDPGRSPN